MDDGTKQIRIVIRQLALQHARDALEPHAGIDGRARKRRHHAVGCAIELHEDQIPDFDEALAWIVGKLACAGFGAEVVIDFRARTARAGIAHLPEVVVFIQAKDARLRNARDLLPQTLGIVILAKDGDVELVLGNGQIRA